MVTNYLPEGLVLTGSSTSWQAVAGSGGTNVWSGSLPPNASTTLILTAQATAAQGATVEDTVVVGSPVYDPFKLNNAASFKIDITPVTLSIVPGARAITFAWPASAANYVLLGATNLTQPIIWVPVTNPAPSIVNGQYSISLPNTTNGLHFFMLSTP
jgi:hypothetical protein